MFRVFRAFLFAVSVGMAGAASAASNSQPLECPDLAAGETFSPGEVFVASPTNPVQRIREKLGSPATGIPLKRDAGLSIYLFVKPAALTEPKAFALLRSYELDTGSTSLDPTKVVVSNSLRDEKSIEKTDYDAFHAQHDWGPSQLRKYFHMHFSDGERPNTYDVIDDPRAYNLPAQTGADAFKARMQRVQGFPPDGRCVRFTLFDTPTFAGLVNALTARLITISRDGSAPDDSVDFTLRFSP